MKNILKQEMSATLALGAAALMSAASAQSGQPQPGVPMGPTKAGPNAAVTGSTTAAGNSGAPAQSVGSPANPPTNAAAAGKPTSNTPPTGMSKALSSADRRFMEKAAQDGMAEVEAGKLAQKNGANADVKKFGERMAMDHAKAGDELKALAESKGVKLPDKTDRTHARLAKQLAGLTGDKFDKVYAREAGVKDHKSAVAMFTREAQRAGDADVKAFAAKTLPTLQEHLMMAHAMHDSVMGPAKK
jgi:putative membrane protein